MSAIAKASACLFQSILEWLKVGDVKYKAERGGDEGFLSLWMRIDGTEGAGIAPCQQGCVGSAPRLQPGNHDHDDHWVDDWEAVLPRSNARGSRPRPRKQALPARSDSRPSTCRTCGWGAIDDPGHPAQDCPQVVSDLSPDRHHLNTPSSGRKTDELGMKAAPATAVIGHGKASLPMDSATQGVCGSHPSSKVAAVLVLLSLCPLLAGAAPECAEPYDSPDHAQDWTYISVLYEERDFGHLGPIEARLQQLELAPGEGSAQRSERVALRVALLDAKATIEWTAARQSGAPDLAEFEWQYRALHSHRAEQQSLLRDALQADPGHPLLVRSLLHLVAEDAAFDSGWVRQQLEQAVARSPEDVVLRYWLVEMLVGAWDDFDAAVVHIPGLLRAEPQCGEQEQTPPWNESRAQVMFSVVAAVARESRPCWWPLRHRVLSRTRAELGRGKSRSASGFPDDQSATALRNHFVDQPERLSAFLTEIADEFEQAQCIPAPASPQVNARSLLPHLVELDAQHCEDCRILVEVQEPGPVPKPATATLRSRQPGSSRIWLRATPSTAPRWQVFAARRVDPRELHPPPPLLPSEAVLVELQTVSSFTRPPETPLWLSVEDLGPYAIRLRWQAADALAYGFELQECIERQAESCSRVALIGFDLLQFDYTHAAPAEKRRYELRAFNPLGASAPAMVHWTAERDPELEELHEAWRRRQPEREAQSMLPQPSAIVELAAHMPGLPSVPWRLYPPRSDLPAHLQPNPGAEGLWRPIESTDWAERCTSRDELVELPLEAFGLRLEWQGRVRLEDGDKVDVFAIREDDTQCDFGACPGWIAFGSLPGGDCYAHRGWALPAPPDFEPALGIGWERGSAGENAFVYCTVRGRVQHFSTCTLSEDALPTLLPPLVERRGHVDTICQGWPLAGFRQ